MAFLLVQGKGHTVLTCARGVPAIVQSYSSRNGGRLNFFHHNKNVPIPNAVALFRTSVAGRDFGPYESPQMRQSSSTSLDVPSLEEVITKEKAAESESALKQKENQRDNVLMEKALTRSLTVLTKTYDFLTLPVYAAIQQPWKKLALHNSIKAKTIDKEGQIYTSVAPISELHQEIVDSGCTTLAKLYQRSVDKHGDKKSLGVREILSEEEVLDPSTGKYMKKYELGDYKWKTYSQVDKIVNDLSRGFDVLQLKPKEKIAIFAETREEWFITAMAAFKKNLPICTVFTTLADEGVIHALTETEVTTLITSEELMPRCQEVLKNVPQIKQLVYMDKPKNENSWKGHSELPQHVSVYTYNQLVARGAQSIPKVEEVNAGPEPNDVAIIMYTSGSTGVPKGVMLSHKNIVSGLKSSLDVTAMVGKVEEDDTYLAYLPLAHAMELACELMTFIQGIPIGYSSPLTLIDKSLGVKEGSVGDATIIRPSVFPAVPLVVERICKGIKEKVAESGPVKELLFNYFYNYKVGWKRLGYETPLVDKIFFSKITSLVGGRMRYLVVGGAPLAPQTQEFISTCLCCALSVGYGMTESCATGAMTYGHDLSFGRAGSPINGSFFRLVDWEDGGYRTTDKPYPRGEIYMGGDNIALGYFKRENSTDFFEEGGKRWIKTGDIAEVHPDGTFVIIDRKKDLVKISTGKFVSLGKVESVLKVSKFVENICVYADSLSDYTVALVVPSRPNLEKLAKKLGLPLDNYTELCYNPRIHEAVLNDIQTQGKLLNLSKSEIPRRITLCPEPWVPQSGLVTAAFKIKRSNVYKSYKEDINRMYGSS